MIKFLKGLFKREERYVVLEVEKGTSQLGQMTNELRESIKTLQYHPGFQYLVTKFRYEKAMLSKYLHEGFQLSEKELHHLQAGVHYLGYLEREVDAQVKVAVQKGRTALEDEINEFEKIKAATELIGS